MKCDRFEQCAPLHHSAHFCFACLHTFVARIRSGQGSLGYLLLIHQRLCTCGSFFPNFFSMTRFNLIISRPSFCLCCLCCFLHVPFIFLLKPDLKCIIFV